MVCQRDFFFGGFLKFVIGSSQVTYAVDGHDRGTATIVIPANAFQTVVFANNANANDMQYE